MLKEMSKTRRYSERLKTSKTNICLDATQKSCKRLRQTRQRTASFQSATGIGTEDKDSVKQPPAKRRKKQQKPVSSKYARIYPTKAKKGRRKTAKQETKSNAIELNDVQFPLPDNQRNILMEQPLTPFTSNDDDDADDALPRFDFVPDEKFGEGDLIWVKHGKDPHWPAVALKLINHRKRLHKVRVGFIEYDENKKLKHKPMSLKYSSTRMQPISKDYDTRKNGHMIDKVSDRFKKAIESVERFLFSPNRPKLKAKDYFGMTEKSFSKTKGINTDGEEDSLDTAAAPLSSKLTDDSGAVNSLDAGIKSGVKPEEDEDEKDVIEVKDSVSFIHDARPTYSEDTYRRIHERRRQELELVNLIKHSSEVKAHLKSVLLGRKNSTYHSAFHKPGKTRHENRLLKTLGFGPIENELYIDELTRYLQNHLCDIENRPKKSDDIYYLTDVWLPEAITFGIHLQRKVRPEEAEQVFARGIEYTPEEMADFVDDMITNTTDEDRAEQRARRKRRLESKALNVV